MTDNTDYLERVRALSDRIVAAQRPIRVLEATNWGEDIRRQVLSGKKPVMPRVDAEYYRQNRPLGFDVADKHSEFHAIERDITRQLGQLNPLAGIMRRICQEYQMVVRMLQARGTPEFAQLSETLYGAASDVFHAGDPSVAELGERMEQTVGGLLRSPMLEAAPRDIDAEAAVAFLNERMQAVFPGAGIRVMISDGIAADAAAGTDYIKIRRDARFNQQDLDLLEAHEGWVHLGTTLNGAAQPWCTFLGKGPPSATITQEGLAVLTEIIAMRSSPHRLHRLVNRVRAVTLVEQGADFIEIMRFLADKGLDREQAYTLASRVFRGSVPNGGPFTKDITYLKGFIMCFNFLRLAVHQGKLEAVERLFCGKTVIEDMKVLEGLINDGVVVRPTYLPPPFADMTGLAAYLSFNRFISDLSFQQLEADYAAIL